MFGSGADGAQHHPQGRSHHRAVVQRQVIAQVPWQVVPKTAMQHDLVCEQAVRVALFLINVKCIIIVITTIFTDLSITVPLTVR